MSVHFVRLSLLTAAIFLGGWYGLNMVIAPAYASPLWSPAGLSLAALLIWGKKVWPAILLGAFANNVLVGAYTIGGIRPELIVSSALIACASVLQAVAAGFLSERRLGAGVPRLDSPRQTFVFFFLTGPVACLIAASLGVVILFAFSIVPLSLVWSSWVNWWLGDSLGVLVISPLVFCLFAQPSELWGSRMTGVALPLLVTLIALTSIFKLVYQSEKARVQLAFDNEAGIIDRLFIEYANNAIDSSLSLRDLYIAASPISRQQFASFSQSVLQRHPELQALEWIPRVLRTELANFEQQVRAEGYGDFKVVEKDSDGMLIPVRERDEYYPVTFVEPMQSNLPAFGLDSASNPGSRRSKELARLKGEPSVSQGLFLIQRNDLETAVLLSIPVFSASAADTGNPLAGFVSAVILPARLTETALQDVDLTAFALRLRDLDAAAGRAELYTKKVSHELSERNGLKPWQHQFLFGDRRWQLTIAADSVFLNTHGSMLPWLTLISGLCFTALLSVLLLTISGRTAHVEALVAARTRDLQKANSELKDTEKTLRQSENYLRTILNSEPECVKLLGKDGSLIDMNPAGLAMVEAASIEEIKGSNIYSLLLPQYRTAFNRLVRRVFAGETGCLEFEARGLKGSTRWMETHATPMRDSMGKVIAFLGVSRDITSRKKTESELKLAARVFSEAHEGILITDADAKIVDVNPTFSEITGYSREEVIGKNPSVLQSGKHSKEFYSKMWNALIEKRHWRGEVWNKKKNGELYAELLTMSALCNEQDRIIYYIGLFSDITHFKQQQQMLELLAHYDPLTKLPNRTLFADRLLQAIAHSKREKSLLAICFLDLDGFKPINDQFGHEAGDKVLVEVARRLKSSLREEDTVSRHGGDEFVLLLGDLHSIEECTETLTRIHRAIVEPYAINEHSASISVSSGITVYPLDNADPDTLIRHADHAMYQAKLAGKNRYHLFDAGYDQLVIDHHNQLKEIEKAFTDGQFCLYYQPKVNLKNGTVTGVEALIRWRHPERGILPPSEFLSIPASDELEIRIGNWVMEQAWHQLSDWHRAGLTLEMSVNISAYHLLWPEFTTHLKTILASNPLVNSRSLQLEILESTALDDLSAVNRIIKNCRDDLGVSTALDDFGTGYSSLAHLRHLPVDTVKIDKSFIRDMLDDPDDYAIVESVIGLSQAFGHEVVAEGLETPEQGLTLLMLNCHSAQGYAIAKPMPASEVTAWINAYQPFLEWQTCANQNLGDQQIQIAIHRIALEQWLHRISVCLTNHWNDTAYWPIMRSNKSHFGRWLKQVQQQDQYNKTWLLEVSGLYDELLQLGTILMRQFWAGEVEAARVGFVKLEAIHKRLDECLDKYA
ncbi:EAL domain-containing protein [Methylomonas sp. MgM2]